MRITLPQNVQNILTKLTGAGYEAYAVGGCVRDSLLNEEPKDWDITTSAFPDQVKQLFSRTVDTGIQHGTVSVLFGKESYEITTYRIDGNYEDSRHPKEVSFTASLTEDLKRRDFTINAMAYNEESGLVDLYNGMGDLNQKKIRCVGDPQERFQEDALRMMRAVRFSAQLGFRIEDDVLETIKKLAPNIAKVSEERIRTELVKILESCHPEEIKLLRETGLMKVFLPEVDMVMSDTNEELKLLKMLTQIENIKLRIVGLFFQINSPRIAVEILRRLKFDHITINKTKLLLLWVNVNPELTGSGVRKIMSQAGNQLFPDLFDLQRAVASTLPEKEKEASFVRIKEYQKQWEGILERQECVYIKQLAITGEDIIQLGVPQGKQIGEILNYLLEQVIEDPEKNQFDLLSEKVKEYMQ
jgi:tRNA nucleotidyltransferase (CCA-adding enzyme)